MKQLSYKSIDAIEDKANCNGTYAVFTNVYGKFRLTARVSFYEYHDKYFCIIDESGEYVQSYIKSMVFQYESRDEGNEHFKQLKAQVEGLGNIFRKDSWSV